MPTFFDLHGHETTERLFAERESFANDPESLGDFVISSS
jgi:hypothetical protein